MNGPDIDWEARLAELRRTFDESFAREPVPASGERDAYLIVRVGPDRLAIAVHALAGLAVRCPIVPLPADPATLMGVIGHRGRPVPVYALGALLGRAPAPPDPWIVLTAAAAPVGLAIDALEQYVEAPRSALRTIEGAAAGSAPITESLAIQTGPVEVLRVSALSIDRRG